MSSFPFVCRKRKRTNKQSRTHTQERERENEAIHYLFVQFLLLLEFTMKHMEIQSTVSVCVWPTAFVRCSDTRENRKKKKHIHTKRFWPTHAKITQCFCSRRSHISLFLAEMTSRIEPLQRRHDCRGEECSFSRSSSHTLSVFICFVQRAMCEY